MTIRKIYRMLSCTALVLLLCSSMTVAQDRTVSGKIVDEAGEGLPGVNVIVKGTSDGTVSDGEGQFTLGGISENSTLVFFFI